jgi:endoglucanase
MSIFQRESGSGRRHERGCGGSSPASNAARPRRRPFYRVLAALAAALLVPGGVAAGAAYADSTNQPSNTRTAVEVNGQLRVCGTKLCNEDRQPVQLRGMSTHGLQWYRQCVNDGSMDALATDWDANVMRLSMYIQEGGYETDPERFTQMMHELIEQVSSRGMYVIVDWHMLTPGDPHDNLDLAKTFFAEIAQAHADKPNILYEVANEPNGVDWPTIKAYHEQIIPVIREHDPDSVILLGTRAWSSLGVSDGADETEVVDNPVDAENIMYTFHFYAASHDNEYLDTLSRAADQLPMFVTEFGTQEYTGDGPNDFDMAGQYLDLMADKQIGWTNWNYSDDHRSGAVFNEGTCPDGPYTGTEPLKEAGKWIKDRIAG